MKIKNLKFGFFLFALACVFISCEEDEGPTVTFEERDRGEQQIVDKDSLLSYLSTHYYNSSFFDTDEDRTIEDILITELAEGEEVPEGSTLLIESNLLETIVVDYLDTEYEYYILRLNQGGGESPNFTDRVRVRYEGSNVDEGDVFESISTPVDLNLQTDGFNAGAIKAWQFVIPTFNTAESFTSNADGITDYNDYGFGVMFVPSGLAYYFGTQTGDSYANLIFKFELLQYEVRDHDSDGIPSFVEDLDNNKDVFDDDTDENQTANFIDFDDDGDGVATLNELVQNVRTFNEGQEEPVLDENEYETSRSENEGIITINTVIAVDSNNNGIFDYLDETVTINYNEEES